MQQRRLLRQAALTNLFGTILFEINNWRYAYLSPQPTRRVFLPGNDTGLASVVDWLTIPVQFAHPLICLLHYGTRNRE